MTPQNLIDTEEEIRALWEAGELPYLIHLEGSVDGSYERFLCDYFAENVKPGDWVFASHRCHYVWQLHQSQWLYFRLADEILNLTRSQCEAKTRRELIEKIKAGKSMFLYAPRFVCSAIVAGTASIAAGMALSIQKRGGSEHVHIFGGDGCEDHGHFAEAVRLVWGRGLPATFIITDNDSSCGVTKEQRGSPIDWQWPECVIRVKYQSKWPHAGSNVRPQLKSK